MRLEVRINAHERESALMSFDTRSVPSAEPVEVKQSRKKRQIGSLSVRNDKKILQIFNNAKSLRNSIFTLHHQNETTLKF